MNARSFRSLALGCAVVAGTAASAGAARAQSQPNFFWLNTLMTQTDPNNTPDVFDLNATATNECTASLPSGSELAIRYNGVTVAMLPITALQRGSRQTFSAAVKVPSPPPKSKNGFDALAFAVEVPASAARHAGAPAPALGDDADGEPGVGPDFKTSPCAVTPFIPK